MLGVLDDAYAHRPTIARDGDVIVLVGETRPELGGSEALAVVHDTVAGTAPSLDIGREVALCRLLAGGAGSFAHDLAEGGLAVALAEMCIASGIGASVELPNGVDPLWGLFGESTARALVTCTQDEARSLGGVVLGTLGGSRLHVRDVLDVAVDDLARVYRDAIPSLMER
jgi:phosphoribosylformylglycinamidine synthase